MYFYNKEENKNLKVLEGSFVCLSEIKSNSGAVNSTDWACTVVHPLLGAAGEACLGAL